MRITEEQRRRGGNQRERERETRERKREKMGGKVVSFIDS